MFTCAATVSQAVAAPMARHLKQREQVLHKARWERSTSLYISEDLSPATLQKREPQIPKVKAAKQAGLDRLVA